MLIKYSAEKLKRSLYEKFKVIDDKYTNAQIEHGLSIQSSKIWKMISLLERTEDDTVLLSLEEANELDLI